MSVKLRKKKLSGSKFSLYLDVYHNGKRDYEFLKLYLSKDREHNREILRLAESIRAKRELEIQNSDHGFIPHFKRKANFVEYFEKLCSEKYNNDGNWNNVLNYLREFTEGAIQFSGVTKDWLEEFKKFLLTKVAPISAYTYFSKIIAALNQAVRDGIILANPSNKVSKIKFIEPQKMFLSFEEIKLLSNTPCDNPDVKGAFLFGCYTGMRYSDIVKLTWSQVKEDRIEFRQEKTKSFEYLPLSETARKILYSNNQNRLFMPNAKVFNIPDNKNTNVALRKWAKTAGIDKHISFHVSRHTFATLALTYGADLYTVSKVLGHKEIKTTQIYAKIVDEKKEEAVNLLPEIEVK